MGWPGLLVREEVLHEAPRCVERRLDGQAAYVLLDLSFDVKVLGKFQFPVGDLLRVRHGAPDDVFGALRDGFGTESAGLRVFDSFCVAVVLCECDAEYESSA